MVCVCVCVCVLVIVFDIHECMYECKECLYICVGVALKYAETIGPRGDLEYHQEMSEFQTHHL